MARIVKKKAKTKTKTRAKAEKAIASPLKPVKDKQTKLQFLSLISEETGVPKKDADKVLSALGVLVRRHLMPKGSGEFTIQDLGIKLRRIRKPAQKSRKGRNPFTGEEMVIKAKPARDVIKVMPLKSLKNVLVK